MTPFFYPGFSLHVVSLYAIFPVFTIDLASYIAVREGFAFKTNHPTWTILSRFRTRVFAVVFGMGVVSGIVMAFQFGTNWSNFSYTSANFLGPIFSYEVVTAFFLEATFPGVLLFGRGKVPPGIFLLSAILIAAGTFISSFWILSANSWMQTPAGVEMRGDLLYVTSWSEVIVNASLPYRFVHMALARFLTGGFVVAGVSAWYLVLSGAGLLADFPLVSRVFLPALYLGVFVLLAGLIFRDFCPGRCGRLLYSGL